MWGEFSGTVRKPHLCVLIQVSRVAADRTLVGALAYLPELLAETCDSSHLLPFPGKTKARRSGLLGLQLPLFVIGDGALAEADQIEHEVGNDQSTAS